MAFVQTSSSPAVTLYYEDTGGSGPPVVLLHGWPSSHKMWEYQLAPLVEAGYRVIAYDRRGFGESEKPWTGYDYDTMAADLHDLLTALDVQGATLVGFSMGGGEVARYLRRYGAQGRVAKAALVSAVTPFLLQTSDNPDGVPRAVFDDMREKIRADRFAFLQGFLKDFHGVGLISHPVSQAHLDADFVVTAGAHPHATYACVAAFSETDFRPDMSAFDGVPTLIVHGDADKIVPAEVAGERAAQMIPGARYHVVSGGPHALVETHYDEFNRVLLDFLAGSDGGGAAA